MNKNGNFILAGIVMLLFLSAIIYFAIMEALIDKKMKDFCHEQNMVFKNNIPYIGIQTRCLEIKGDEVVNSYPIDIIEGKVRFIKNG